MSASYWIVWNKLFFLKADLNKDNDFCFQKYSCYFNAENLILKKSLYSLFTFHFRFQLLRLLFFISPTSIISLSFFFYEAKIFIFSNEAIWRDSDEVMKNFNDFNDGVRYFFSFVFSISLFPFPFLPFPLHLLHFPFPILNVPFLFSSLPFGD